jgi:DNA-binding transcriptional LysR family regulator
VEDASGNLPTRLEHGDIDVAEMAANDERFQSRLLFPIHALVVLPHAHRLARRAKVDIIDLAGEPMALPCREFPMRGWIDAAFDAANVRPKLLLESAVPHTLVAVAAANFAIAVVQSNVPIHHKGVRTIPLVVRGASIGIWSAIAWHPRRFLPPYAQRFIEEFASFAPHANPGRDVIRRAPALPRPKEQRH